MLGFGDVWVFLAYALALGSVVLCVAYGILNWNKPVEDEIEEAREEAVWEGNDPELNEGGVK
jgi:hypothetical protein